MGERSMTCKLQWGVTIKALTFNYFELLRHAALGRPHAVWGLTAVHPCICFGHTLKLLLQTKRRWELNYREQQLCVCICDCVTVLICSCANCRQVFAYFFVYSPACPCLCQCCMECLQWPSDPCCLCTSGRWQAAHWVCPYSEVPGLSPQTRSSAPHRTGHEEALRRQRGNTAQVTETSTSLKFSLFNKMLNL